MSHLTQKCDRIGHFGDVPFQPISWFRTEETKLNTTKASNIRWLMEEKRSVVFVISGMRRRFSLFHSGLRTCFPRSFTPPTGLSSRTITRTVSYELLCFLSLVFPYLSFLVPCARLSGPSRQFLSARKYIVSYRIAIWIELPTAPSFIGTVLEPAWHVPRFGFI